MPKAISDTGKVASKEDETPAGGYAVALRMQGRACIVVGGGPVSERKVRELCRAGAAVTVVAPHITDVLRADADAGRIRHRPGHYRPEDIDGAFLVIAATDNTLVNGQVLADAAQRGVLSNRAGSVDSEDTGDFDTMATVRRGDLLIAVTTGGAGPAVSARIRAELAERWGPEWGAWVALLGTMRRRALSEMTPMTRTELLRRLAARDDLRARLAGGDEAEAERVREEAEQMVNEAIQASAQADAEALCPAQ